MAALRPGLRRFLGLGPALAMIGVFMLVPIGIIAVYSLLEADPYGGVEPRFSAEAYIQFFFERDLDDSLVFNPAYLVIFGRSILLAAAAMLASLLIGFPVAYYMATQPAGRRNLLVFLVTIPFWTNLLIRTFCWILILRDHGLVNNLLLAAGIDRPAPDPALHQRRDPAGPGLHLHALHGPADLRQHGEARPPAGRGGPRPLRQPPAGAAPGDPAAGPARDRRRLRSWSSSPAWAPSSPPTCWAAARS